MGPIELQRQSSLIDELDQIEKFFQQLPQPKNLNDIRQRTEEFCRKNAQKRIVLVTVC